MPGSNRRPTACKADVITTTLDPIFVGFTNPAISRSKGAAVGRTPRSELADFAYMVGALTIGFRRGASRAVFASTPSQAQCQHCLQPLLAALLVAREI